MKRNTTLLATIAIFVISFIGCKDRTPTAYVDEQAPVIIMTNPSLIESDAEAVTLNRVYSSTPFDVDIRFEDDDNLKEARIDIIRDEPTSYTYRKANTDPWSESFYIPLSGKTGNYNTAIGIPYDPEAEFYRFRVSVTDMAGNSTTKETKLFVTNLLDSIQPGVSFILPLATDTFQIGDDIVTQASVSDNNTVRDVIIRLHNSLTDEIVPMTEIRLDTVLTSPVAIDTFITVPAGVVPGDYTLKIYANDDFRNVGLGTQEIYIKPN